MCTLQLYRPELNAKVKEGTLNWILKVLTWNILKDGAQRVDGKNSVTCLVAMFTFRVMDFRISEIANFWIFYWWQQNISHSFGNIFKYTWKILSYRSYSQALDCSWDVVCRNTENKCWPMACFHCNTTSSFRSNTSTKSWPKPYWKIACFLRHTT